jgi:hypothetical protein
VLDWAAETRADGRPQKSAVPISMSLVRLGSRLSQTTAAERAALVREFVFSVEVEAEHDQAGKPVFPQGAPPPRWELLVCAKDPRVTVHITYVFPEPGIPRPEQEPPKGQAESEAHGQTCAITLDQSHHLF